MYDPVWDMSQEVLSYKLGDSLEFSVYDEDDDVRLSFLAASLIAIRNAIAFVPDTRMRL